MSPTKQRIAIATACPDVFTYTQSLTNVFVYRAGLKDQFPELILPEFDPLTDLNAMRAAETTLTSDQQSVFVSRLCDVAPNGVGHDWRWLLVHATAAQRAEAFLRTLGLWKE